MLAKEPVSLLLVVFGRSFFYIVQNEVASVFPCVHELAGQFMNAGEGWQAVCTRQSTSKYYKLLVTNINLTQKDVTSHRHDRLLPLP